MYTTMAKAQPQPRKNPKAKEFRPRGYKKIATQHFNHSECSNRLQKKKKKK